MLTEEMLDKVASDATFARDIQSIIVSVHPEIVLAMVEEIERLRGEVESRQRMYETEAEMRRQSERLLETMVRVSRDNAPAPEPAPVEAIKVGDTVRIVQLPGALHGRAGTVVQITGQMPVYTVRVWGGNTLDFMRDQIELADAAPAPEPAPEIKVGDSVRINRPGSMNHGRVLKITAIHSGVSHPYDAAISDPNVFFSYTRDEIEPA